MSHNSTTKPTQDLTDHHGDDANDPSIIQINQSNETVQAAAGKNIFVIASSSQTGDVINGFTVGQDVLKIHGDASHLTLQQSAGNTVIVDGANTLVTLNGIQATDLKSLLDPDAQNEQHQVTVTHVDQSSQTVAATAAHDLFVFGSAAQTSDVITGFTSGQDALVIHGLHDHGQSSGITLAPDADGVSTDVNVGSDGHTLVTIENVLPGALTVHGHFIA